MKYNGSHLKIVLYMQERNPMFYDKLECKVYEPIMPTTGSKSNLHL